MEALEAHLRRQADHSRDFFWHRLRWRAVREWLPADRPFELVDVGAGIGLLGDFLGRDLPHATYRFVEPIDFLERQLEDRFGTAANVGSEERYEGADYIALLDVLEHQEDDHRFLRELAHKMEPGATLLLTVPALEALWSRWDDALGHYHRYEKSSLGRVIAGAPLEILELSYLFPEMTVPALVRKRKLQANGSVDEEASAEFPDLPRALNEALYGLGTLSLRVRRRAPFGTSLLAVCRRC